MLFSSLTFLLYFLPVVLILYSLIKPGWRPAFLLAASLVFYGWLNPEYLILILAETLLGFYAGLWISKSNARKGRKILIGSAALLVIIFCFFKYTDFVIGSINSAFHSSLKLLNIVLPLGISFYTFQTLSYCPLASASTPSRPCPTPSTSTAGMCPPSATSSTLARMWSCSRS